MRAVQLLKESGRESYFLLQEPGEILEKEAFKLCLGRQVTSEHTEIGQVSLGRANPSVRSSLSGGADSLRGEQSWCHPAELRQVPRLHKGRSGPGCERTNAKLRILAKSIL